MILDQGVCWVPIVLEIIRFAYEETFGFIENLKNIFLMLWRIVEAPYGRPQLPEVSCDTIIPFVTL